VPLTQNHIARRTDDGKTQTLQAHTESAAKMAREFAETSGVGQLARAAGMLHDSGKGTDGFQEYLLRGGAKVRHSIYGAKRAYDDFCGCLPAAEMISNCIASHHGSLRDYISPDGRLPLLAELSEKLCDMPDADGADVDVKELLSEIQAAIVAPRDKWFVCFAFSMLTKLIYSCLVDADRLDARLFETGEDFSQEKPEWGEMRRRLEVHLGTFTSDSEMSVLRRKVSEQCAEAGLRERGIYQLSVPTGGGKTLSSMRFALAHAEKHGMSRIIYVIPYLSILEQTAEAIRGALGVDGDVVLEHHSNILPDDPEHYKFQTDRWDSPIILTSLVQFLESIFSAKGSDLRKLHNMTDSVIIFDEIQSLPIKCVHLFNDAVNFLYKTGRSTALLCTATQPLLDTVPRKILLSENPSVADGGEAPARTKIVSGIRPAGYSYEESAEFIRQKHESSTLVIVNTKVAAKSVFKELKSTCASVLHLSTNMCPAHRDAVFAELRDKLKKREPVICVSTQLIEAGVDISFECVIRDVAGLDSIFQAAGRCNRHGEFGCVKNVYVVNLHTGADDASADGKKDKLRKLPDIKIGADITYSMLDRGTEDMDEYYRHYFHARKEEMDYPVDGGSVYDLLSCNLQGTNALKNSGNGIGKTYRLPSAIRSAADKFYVIEPGQTGVVVPYGDGLKALEEYAAVDDLRAKKRLLQRLGRYTVSLYKFQTDALEKSRALNKRQDCEGILVLDGGFYDAETGVDLGGHPEFLNV